MIEDLLERIRSGLKRGVYPNERAVSTSIVVPILRALGWDDSDPEEVLPEHTTGRGRVDYALRVSPKPLAAFIEVKGVGRSGEADRQLFEYAFHEGVPLAILTDGREWSFYLPAQQGSYADRRAYQLVLDERELGESADRLNRYLRRDRIASGEALDAAIRDYKDARSRREASATLPAAWNELLAEPDPTLMASLLERTEALCGFRPTELEAEDFLRQRVSADATPRPRQTVPSRVSNEPAANDPVSSGAGRSRCSWTFGNRSGTAKNAIDALVSYLDAAFAAHPDRSQQIMAAARTRSRNNIATELVDVYPRQPDIAAKCHRQLANGLFVGTNLSNHSKLHLARQIATAVNVKFGDGAKLEIPG